MVFRSTKSESSFSCQNITVKSNKHWSKSENWKPTQKLHKRIANMKRMKEALLEEHVSWVLFKVMKRFFPRKNLIKTCAKSEKKRFPPHFNQIKWVKMMKNMLETQNAGSSMKRIHHTRQKAPSSSIYTSVKSSRSQIIISTTTAHT